MLEQFLGLPSYLIIALSVLAPVLFAVPIVRLVTKKRIDTRDDDNTVLAPTIAFIGTAFTLLLAFVIVNIWSDQVAKQDVLFKEMTTIENILIEVKIIDPTLAPQLKDKVLEYMDDVVKYEIDQKPPIGGDKVTEETFEQVLVMIDQLERKLSADPTTAAEAQSFFEETREWITDREMRVNKASGELDPTFTLILVFLALLTVMSVALLPASSALWAKWTQTIGVATAVGLVMGLVFYIASDSFTKGAEEEQILRIEEALYKSDVAPMETSNDAPSEIKG